MTQPPRLTDRATLDRQRRRASAAPALFLQDLAADDIQERLEAVNRRFTNPAVVTSLPDLWRARLPDARIIADTEVLDLAEGAHDLIIHAMALHWADDPVGQLVQCRRALQPDGLFLGTLFGGQTLNELRAAFAEAESQVTGGLSPRVLPMAEIRDLGALLQRAGFALPVADSASFNVSYRDILHLMHDLRAMGETNAMAARNKRPLPRAVLALSQDIYARNFPAGDERISASFEIATLTGWAPDDSQQKPLRPGSASHRLADFLWTDELPLDGSGD